MVVETLKNTAKRAERDTMHRPSEIVSAILPSGFNLPSPEFARHA